MQKLIPPVVFLISLLVILGIDALNLPSELMRADRTMPWDIPLILGLVALIWGRLHFKKRDAEIMTFNKPNSLITDGPFRFSRNPMYLGFLLLLVAAAFLANSWYTLLIPLGFLLISALWYIPFEERMMRETFGSTYDEYANRTRRWI